MKTHSFFHRHCHSSISRLAVVTLVVLVALAWSSPAFCQGIPSVSISTDKSGKTRTFLAGEISIRGDTSTIETKSFTCTPVYPLKKGDKVAAIISDDQAWSADSHSLLVGTNQVPYPILAMVKSADGFHSVFPAILKTKTDIKAGEMLRSDGYQIEAKRGVKAGESIPVLFIGDSLLSVEAAEGTKNKSEAKPWFTAYKDDTKASDRAALVEAWRLENEHVGR
jgi:hypothetical protein